MSLPTDATDADMWYLWGGFFEVESVTPKHESAISYHMNIDTAMQGLSLVMINNPLVDIYGLVIHIMQVALLLLCSWRITDQIELYDAFVIMGLLPELYLCGMWLLIDTIISTRAYLNFRWSKDIGEQLHPTGKTWM